LPAFFIFAVIFVHPMRSYSLIESTVIPLRLIFVMWAVFFFNLYVPYVQIEVFGIIPRTLFGLIGIVTAPLIHGSPAHLVSNTVPLLFLGSVLFYFYGGIAQAVFLRAYFWTNILVWLFARTANHIGASGLIYGLAFFLIFFGIFRRDFLSIFISIIVLLLYGGVFYGVLPTDPVVSWESHLGGALVGISTAISFSRQQKVN
jgi:membrane associated rhomboid family serine protease